MKETRLSAVAGTAVMAGMTRAETITSGHFLDWPMPFEYAKVEGLYEDAMGVGINWVSFDTGTAMSAAMASGDVHLPVSQGVPPFVVAASAGQDLQALDVAVRYSDNDNCIVAEALEIDKDSADEMAGKKVAVPLGSAAHYGFKQMRHFGVDLASLDLVGMAPPDGAAALAQGSIDVACGSGGSLRRMKEHGNVLLTGAENEKLGILVFDVTSGPTSRVVENSDIVARCLKVTAEANATWADEADHAKMLPVIATDAGMDEDATMEPLSIFVFPTVEKQPSDKWLGGVAQDVMLGVADVFVDAGSIDAAQESDAGTVNIGPHSPGIPSALCRYGRQRRPARGQEAPRLWRKAGGDPRRDLEHVRGNHGPRASRRNAIGDA
ncbi:taurine transport system substrate-binding protein [Sagittula marina]|uniref:Taurine transport system substrate-binding protein n=1 Tax=Sagittula marina TaxID=943940 RepID=A0A7W6DSM3_9RHOB|nr:taurine ABC transporter substrate-binding protein [Sagittula marina]MBB3985965.1 taurine transport system substrate-binding protein [Sagittula marina]